MNKKNILLGMALFVCILVLLMLNEKYISSSTPTGRGMPLDWDEVLDNLTGHIIFAGIMSVIIVYIIKKRS